MKAETKCYRCDELFSRESDYRTLCDNCMHDTEELLESIGRPPDDGIELVGKVDGWILHTTNLENARWYISELRHNLVPRYAWEVQGEYYILIPAPSLLARICRAVQRWLESLSQRTDGPFKLTTTM
jgi:hypothetical protein